MHIRHHFLSLKGLVYFRRSLHPAVFFNIYKCEFDQSMDQNEEEQIKNFLNRISWSLSLYKSSTQLFSSRISLRVWNNLILLTSGVAISKTSSYLPNLKFHKMICWKIRQKFNLNILQIISFFFLEDITSRYSIIKIISILWEKVSCIFLCLKYIFYFFLIKIF